MVLWTDADEWRAWGRFSKNQQRTYDEAAWLQSRPDVADVRIDRTITIHEQLTVADMLAQLVATPPRPNSSGGSNSRQDKGAAVTCTHGLERN
jgi:hypothetical protein